MMWILAWKPFLQPLPVDDYWLLLLGPLVVAICLVYKAIKVENLDQLPRQTLNLTLQFVALMAIAAAVLWVLSEWA